jgi:hypothetical protein
MAGIAPQEGVIPPGRRPALLHYLQGEPHPFIGEKRCVSAAIAERQSEWIGKGNLGGYDVRRVFRRTLPYYMLMVNK